MVASGTCHSVREFVQAAFDLLGLAYQKYVEIDEKLYRTAEVPTPPGGFVQGQRKAGLQPRLTSRELVKELTNAGLRYHSGLNDLRI